MRSSRRPTNKFGLIDEMTDVSQPRETSRILVTFSYYTKSVVLQALASRLTVENAMIARPKQKI